MAFNRFGDFDWHRHVKENAPPEPMPVTLGPRSKNRYQFPPEPTPKPLPPIRRNFNRRTTRNRPSHRAGRAVSSSPDFHVAKVSFSYVDSLGDRQEIIKGVTHVHYKSEAYRRFPENFA